ncbi:MAG: carbamoyl-phosphate synthase large subunit [Rickettsiales bacterium]|nr:carbamoyl-phosphate synthase large subunit [Pseudomonadota bacterium]MDA0965854.1 carbamoyl-phosphate synthase large subunit [Pseudomonadota bacterium]MDG4542676.1 carbamoyl-phosphate synthase large subunit [Rickettsiales bacterium]MDG4545180.1 carbamoyl-phosphate synthase large subunit [Rickettsiales bacterium]MDG4547303.1 carbamoyl-phosphate synthase large subunit [Rickettsiales bacterium]
MPKRTDIESILIIGAGPIVIGQACEFDYSGTQACKVLRAEGYRIILVNSNPATIMTDPELADATYVEPITTEIVEKIIAKEKPDAILPTVGGQTALNCAMDLARLGILDKYGVELIGAKPDVIEKAENRHLFNEAMDRIGLEVPRNRIVRNLSEADEALDYVGLPAIIRPSFTLGGSGGGVAFNKEEYHEIVKSGLDASPTNEVQIDQSILGWKEYEMEVVRDKADNCIIICAIENVDPMGVHTGDSITVAPALTLTDKEYQLMRDASLAVLREIGVDTGGSNVQFAVDPETGRLVVIEMNPRVSRSSALASKATGFPIAKVAAKLAVGYTLDEIRNDCTEVTPASFEPVIDYVVTKIPRFNFEKFKGSEPLLTSAMKSVGEAMAIGRCFAESLQKALRSMETGLDGLNETNIGDDIDSIRASLAKVVPERILNIAQAIRQDVSLDEIHRITKFDPWFLEQLKTIVDAEKDVQKNGLPKNKEDMLSLKQLGFSDRRLAKLASTKPEKIADIRKKLGVTPVYKRVDTCAAEFESLTPYMYSCYENGDINGAECESNPTDKEKIIILGGGPNRIGQGIEFDYCCVHAVYALQEAGYETIMVNCNPETVSTDYDTADRLYFEPLTVEDVLSIVEVEASKGKLKGMIVQYGGQTPLKIARQLEAAGVPIIGTSPDAIDLAEDRECFKALLNKLGLKQPVNDICSSLKQVEERAKDMGFPLVVRPSYVLGGSNMAIVHDHDALIDYFNKTTVSFEDGPILLDGFLTDAVEVDVDAISDTREVYIAGIMEHIEEAGIHSGDSACSLPPYSLSDKIIEQIKEQTRKLALALKVKGLMNVQFAVKDGDIYILEVNPRASRTVPFVAKSTNTPIAKIAARIMAGETLASFNLKEKKLKHVAVKEAVLPFARFPNVDVLLGPEMKSTGEAMGLDRDFGSAFAKSQLSASNPIPTGGTVFISVKDSDKKHIKEFAKTLIAEDFKIIATRGTAQFLNDSGIEAEKINKVLEGRPHIVDLIKDGGVDLIINTSEGAKSIADSYSIRRTALLNKVPYSTTIAGSKALIKAICRMKEEKGLEVFSLQSYF